MWKIIFLFWAAQSAEMKFSSPQYFIGLQETPTQLLFYTGRERQVLQLRPCNRSLVAKFWADISAIARHSPRSHSRSLQPSLELNGKMHWVLEEKYRRRLNRLPAEFFTLRALDKKKCGS